MRALVRLVGSLALVPATMIITAGCAGDTTSSPADAVAISSAPSPVEEPATVRLLAHDSFVLSEDLITRLKADTGISLEIISGADAGTMVAGAVLAAGSPTADVMFGVDNTLLSRAVAAGVFEPYTSSQLGSVVPALRDDTARGIVTPIDYGDVCINIDDAALEAAGVPAPASLDDLIDPTYRDMLVVQDPGTSSPGLAFLLATIARYGDAWPDYWERLTSNDVAVVNGWSEAYLSEFTAGGGSGSRPLVVSYSTSPPAEIVYAEPPPPERPSTSVMLDGCYRQVEFAGVLRGTQEPQAARAVVDWLVSPDVQADVPLSMFVFPARDQVPLPDVFDRFVTRPAEPLELRAEEIAAQRDEWIEQWTQLVLR